MKFALDYDKLIFLDAEELAEGGIAEAYAAVLPHLKQYVAEPAEVREVADPSAPRYLVRCWGVDYPIYSPELPDEEGQSWGRAAHALFKIMLYPQNSEGRLADARGSECNCRVCKPPKSNFCAGK
jgi:hypothetical protein